MKRSMEKAIAEYEEISRKQNTGFYSTDICELYEMWDGNPWSLASKAARAGFAIGYRAAKRHARKNALTSAATRARA